jgi:hypothetical protein
MGAISGTLTKEVYPAGTGVDGATSTVNGTSIPVHVHTEGSYTVVSVQIEGISGDTCQLQGTIDRSTWYPLAVENMSTGLNIGSDITADGIYRVVSSGLLNVRAAVTAYSAGTIDATITCA